MEKSYLPRKRKAKTQTKAKIDGKVEKAKITVNGLTLSQMKRHQDAVAALSRWMSRLTRAANQVAKHAATVKRYERITKATPNQG